MRVVSSFSVCDHYYHASRVAARAVDYFTDAARVAICPLLGSGDGMTKLPSVLQITRGLAHFDCWWLTEVHTRCMRRTPADILE
jgi:hypothetical protein